MATQISYQRLTQLTSTVLNVLFHLGYQQCIPQDYETFTQQLLLEQVLGNLLQMLPSKTILQQCSQINVKSHQNHILDSDLIKLPVQDHLIKVLTELEHVSTNLSKMAIILSQQVHSLQLHKYYRKLYQSIGQINTNLQQINLTNKYQTIKTKVNNQIVINYKKIIKILTQSRVSLSNIYQSCKLTTDTQQNHQKQIYTFRNNPQQDNIIDQLKKQIIRLQQCLQSNNQQFAYQIQRYNITLYDLHDQIHRYQLQIANLQDQLTKMEQQKYHDQLLMQNMSKKIRFYEKEKNSRPITLSPSNLTRSVKDDPKYPPGIFLAPTKRTHLHQ